MWMDVSGTIIKLTPAEIDVCASPLTSPVAARCVDTIDDEHAVSMPTHGPTTPDTNIVHSILHLFEQSKGAGSTASSCLCFNGKGYRHLAAVCPFCQVEF